MDLGIRNAEGYYDLTAFQAIRNVIREENRKKAMYVRKGKMAPKGARA